MKGGTVMRCTLEWRMDWTKDRSLLAALAAAFQQIGMQAIDQPHMVRGGVRLPSEGRVDRCLALIVAEEGLKFIGVHAEVRVRLQRGEIVFFDLRGKWASLIQPFTVRLLSGDALVVEGSGNQVSVPRRKFFQADKLCIEAEYEEE